MKKEPESQEKQAIATKAKSDQGKGEGLRNTKQTEPEAKRREEENEDGREKRKEPSRAKRAPDRPSGFFCMCRITGDPPAKALAMTRMSRHRGFTSVPDQVEGAMNRECPPRLPGGIKERLLLQQEMRHETTRYVAAYLDTVDEFPNLWASGREKEKEDKILRDETIPYSPPVELEMLTCEVCGAQFVRVIEQ